MYEKKFKSVTSHALWPPSSLSETVTASQTPSPSIMTYFMVGPLGGDNSCENWMKKDLVGDSGTCIPKWRNYRSWRQKH